MSDHRHNAQEGTFLKPEHTKGTAPKTSVPKATVAKTPVPRAPILPPNGHLSSDCRNVASILARVGDKWSVFVIMLLGPGPRRFNEIKRMIDGISQRMLTLTLRGLERDGLVTRTVYPTIPPRVDYELTDLGRGLWTPVEALGKWAFDHQPEIEGARRKFDQRNDEG